MSWEGHEEMGRGAIFANYDDARAGGKLNEVSGDRLCLSRVLTGLCLSFGVPRVISVVMGAKRRV